MLVDDKERERLEMSIEGETVFARYEIQSNHLLILHVEAAVALRGTGAAGRFMHELMGYIRKRGLKAIPICSYAKTWISRHAEFSDLLGKD